MPASLIITQSHASGLYGAEISRSSASTLLEDRWGSVSEERACASFVLPDTSAGRVLEQIVQMDTGEEDTIEELFARVFEGGVRVGSRSDVLVPDRRIFEEAFALAFPNPCPCCWERSAVRIGEKLIEVYLGFTTLSNLTGLSVETLVQRVRVGYLDHYTKHCEDAGGLRVVSGYALTIHSGCMRQSVSIPSGPSVLQAFMTPVS